MVNGVSWRSHSREILPMLPYVVHFFFFFFLQVPHPLSLSIQLLYNALSEHVQEKNKNYLYSLQSIQISKSMIVAV